VEAAQQGLCQHAFSEVVDELQMRPSIISGTSKRKKPSIIEPCRKAALTGSIHPPSMWPHLSIAARQFIDEILAFHEAGSAAAHLHTRDRETRLLGTLVYLKTVQKKKNLG
jgi:hypothetical protein